MSAARARARAALRMVVRRPVRSALAGLGVAVAVAALVMAEAVAERGRADALDEIRRMGSTVLTVSAEQSRNRGSRGRTGGAVTTLTLRDARDVERLVPGVLMVSGELRSTIPVKVGDLARQATVSGIEPSYAWLREAPMHAGRFFDMAEDDGGQRVAVLGARIEQDLYGARNAVGEQIRIRGIPFIVIGVLPDRGTGLDAFDEDEVVFVPLKTARRRLFKVEYVQRLFLRARPAANLGEVAEATSSLLRARHRPAGAEPPDFRVQDQRRLVALRETAVERLRFFEVTVAVALLAAGAGGVCALQLLAVRERRSEIGTRRALGATRAMIFSQFLLEAAVITTAGGALGIALAYGGSALAGVRASSALTVSAFVACCACGVLAAAEPARRAASLPPVVAYGAQ